MRFFTDKKFNTLTRYVIFIIAVTLLMILTIFKFNTIINIFSTIFKVLSPIIWGLAIAFILNPVMVYIEKGYNKIFCRKKAHPKAARRISVLLTTLITLSLIIFLGYMIIPEIRDSIFSIPKKIKPGIDNLQDWANNFLKNYPSVNNFINEQFTSIDNYANKIVNTLTPTISKYFPEVSRGIINILVSLKDFVLGFIVSIYLLLSKDTLISQSKKTLLALFHKKTCEKATILYRNSNKMFSGFITGKIVDSIIIGILAYFILRILNFENSVLISVIIGVTNIIPFFGPFIGAIPAAFLVLIEQPQKLLMFIIFVFLLQQFDGNILGPKILGDSTGLPAFWVLFAIFLGGGLFGFIGMLLGVPTFAVIYAIFRTYVETRLREKKLPVSTSDYKGNIDHMFTVIRAKDIETISDANDKTDNVPIEKSSLSEENSDKSPNIHSYEKYLIDSPKQTKQQKDK